MACPARGGQDAWLTMRGAAQATFYHPEPVTRTSLNGKPIAFTQNGQYVSFMLPVVSEGHLETASGNGAVGWRDYE